MPRHWPRPSYIISIDTMLIERFADDNLVDALSVNPDTLRRTIIEFCEPIASPHGCEYIVVDGDDELVLDFRGALPWLEMLAA